MLERLYRSLKEKEENDYSVKSYIGTSLRVVCDLLPKAVRGLGVLLYGEPFGFDAEAAVGSLRFEHLVCLTHAVHDALCMFDLDAPFVERDSVVVSRGMRDSMRKRRIEALERVLSERWFVSRPWINAILGRDDHPGVVPFSRCVEEEILPRGRADRIWANEFSLGRDVPHPRRLFVDENNRHRRAGMRRSRSTADLGGAAVDGAKRRRLPARGMEVAGNLDASSAHALFDADIVGSMDV
jgi:hypothetical protein